MVTQSSPKLRSGKMKSRLSSKYRPITLEYPSDLYLRKWAEPYKEWVTSVPRNIYFKFWNKREVVKGRFVGDIFSECLRHWVYCVKRPGWLHKKGSRCADTHSDCDERSGGGQTSRHISPDICPENGFPPDIVFQTHTSRQCADSVFFQTVEVVFFQT